VTSNLDLSIIVVSWNVRDLLEACLRSIVENIDLPAESYEVFVVDNDSADGSAGMVADRFPGFRLIANRENLGFGRANNQAYKQCRGKYALLLNPDAEVRGDAVLRMLEIMERLPDVGVLGARLINSDGTFQRASGGALPTLYNVAWHYLFLYQLLPRRWAPPPFFLTEDLKGTFDIGWVSGAALMLRPAAAGAAIFDEQFFIYGEDLDLCDRVQRDGWRVAYTSEATVMHHLRQSLTKQTSAEIMARAITGNRAYFKIRHGRLKTWLHDLILTIGYFVRWCCFGLLPIADGDATRREKAVTSKRYALVAFKMLLRGGR
jgi:GT2 family glycosyltransferase